jgi:hypothetical protein
LSGRRLRRHTGKMPVPRRAAQVWCLACTFRRSKYLSLSHARTTRKQKTVPCLSAYSVCFVIKNPSNKKSLRLCASALNNPEPCPKNLGVHGVLAVPKARAALLFSRLRATAWSQQERLTRDLRLAAPKSQIPNSKYLSLSHALPWMSHWSKMKTTCSRMDS